MSILEKDDVDIKMLMVTDIIQVQLWQMYEDIETMFLHWTWRCQICDLIHFLTFMDKISALTI